MARLQAILPLLVAWCQVVALVSASTLTTAPDTTSTSYSASTTLVQGASGGGTSSSWSPIVDPTLATTITTTAGGETTSSRASSSSSPALPLPQADALVAPSSSSKADPSPSNDDIVLRQKQPASPMPDKVFPPLEISSQRRLHAPADDDYSEYEDVSWRRRSQPQQPQARPKRPPRPRQPHWRRRFRQEQHLQQQHYPGPNRPRSFDHRYPHRRFSQARRKASPLAAGSSVVPKRVREERARSVPPSVPAAASSAPSASSADAASEDEDYADEDESGSSGFSLRSMLGVSEYCLSEDDVQHACTFTPVCWMSGGTASNGCNSMLYSCCAKGAVARNLDSNTIDLDLLDVGESSSTSGGGGGKSSSKSKRKKSKKRPTGAVLDVDNEPECGVSKHSAFSKRIIGGERAKFAELPWQVHIRISSYQCGGVLLNHWFVATAAHCVHQAKLSQITVHLGEYDTKDEDKSAEPLDSESFSVEYIRLHPDFRYMLTQPDRFDVALLKLDHPVFYRDNIIPICLPTLDIPLEGKVGVVAGWGKTDNSFGKTGTNLLNKVLVPVIGNRKCRGWHEQKNIAVQLHDEMFCAGHEDGQRDACLGDSGGPLVLNLDGKWTLMGITSAGFGCAVEKQPGIYHKITTTAEWIFKQIQKP